MNPEHPRDSTPNDSWGHQTLRIERAPQTMDDDLKPWGLYSLEGAHQPESLESMKNLFTRYRNVRGKGTNHAYTEDALQRSWCAFIRRWNASRREGASFTSWIEGRESTHGDHAIGVLRRRVCHLTRDGFHMCYVHVREGCPRCHMERPRPMRQEWDDMVCARGMPSTSDHGSDAMRGDSKSSKYLRCVT